MDTIEFIYPDVSIKGQFIKTKRRDYRPTKEDGIVLKAVPTEYENISKCKNLEFTYNSTHVIFV